MEHMLKWILRENILKGREDNPGCFHFNITATVDVDQQDIKAPSYVAYIGIADASIYMVLLGGSLYNTVQFVYRKNKYRAFLVLVFYTLNNLLCILRIVQFVDYALGADLNKNFDVASICGFIAINVTVAIGYFQSASMIELTLRIKHAAGYEHKVDEIQTRQSDSTQYTIVSITERASQIK